MGLYLLAVAFLLFAVFAARLWATLRRSEGDPAWLSAASFGSGMLYVALSLVSLVFIDAERLAAGRGIDLEMARVLHALNSGTYIVSWGPAARIGWRLIGYEVPVGKRSKYFAFVAPEVGHVHLGFEYGVWMTDPDNLLLGAHLKLLKVRFATYEPGDLIPEATLVEYTRDAARLATMSRAERMAREFDRQW